jgi:hypothetical protein
MVRKFEKINLIETLRHYINILSIIDISKRLKLKKRSNEFLMWQLIVTKRLIDDLCIYPITLLLADTYSIVNFCHYGIWGLTFSCRFVEDWALEFQSQYLINTGKERTLNTKFCFDFIHKFLLWFPRWLL